MSFVLFGLLFLGKQLTEKDGVRYWAKAEKK